MGMGLLPRFRFNEGYIDEDYSYKQLNTKDELTELTATKEPIFVLDSESNLYSLENVTNDDGDQQSQVYRYVFSDGVMNESIKSWTEQIEIPDNVIVNESTGYWRMPMDRNIETILNSGILKKEVVTDGILDLGQVGTFSVDDGRLTLTNPEDINPIGIFTLHSEHTEHTHIDLKKDDKNEIFFVQSDEQSSAEVMDRVDYLIITNEIFNVIKQ